MAIYLVSVLEMYTQGSPRPSVSPVGAWVRLLRLLSPGQSLWLHVAAEIFLGVLRLNPVSLPTVSALAVAEDLMCHLPVR